MEAMEYTEDRSFEIETPMGSIKSDSGSHSIDVLSVLGVIAILFIGKTVLKKLIDLI